MCSAKHARTQIPRRYFIQSYRIGATGVNVHVPNVIFRSFASPAFTAQLQRSATRYAHTGGATPAQSTLAATPECAATPAFGRT